MATKQFDLCMYIKIVLSLQKDEKYIFQCQFNVSTSIWVLSSLIFEKTKYEEKFNKMKKGWHFFRLSVAFFPVAFFPTFAEIYCSPVFILL